MIAAGVAASGASMAGAYALTDMTRPENAKSVYDEVMLVVSFLHGSMFDLS